MLHKHGGDIYGCPSGQRAGEIQDFSANINFRGMPGPVRLAARDAVTRSTHYPDPECRALREALAKRETALLREQDGSLPAGQRETDDLLTPSGIICGNGAAELMFALAAARRPQRALLAVPSFFEYEQALTAFGCEIRHFALRAQQEFRLGRDFADAIGEDTDCVVLGNPNNPTGQLIDRRLLDLLIRRCSERNILLVLDESFYDFLCQEDRERTESGVRESLSNPGLFVIKSFTKIYGMPGLRFGYGICSDAHLLENMRAVLQPWNVSVPAQAAAAQAAAELAFARESARLNRENRVQLARWLEEDGYRVFPSDANFLLFQGPAGLQEFCLKRGFLIRDCSNFPGLGAGFFRVCVRSAPENAALARVLAEAER